MGVETLFGDKIRFSCEKGHALVGSSDVFCQSDGTWSDTAPECQGNLNVFHRIKMNFIAFLISFERNIIYLVYIE